MNVLAAAQPFVVTRAWAHLLAFVALALVAVAMHALMVTRSSGAQARTATGAPVMFRRRGVKGLVVGKDGRASTSKVQVVLWTLAVMYALLFLLVWGRTVGCGSAAPTHRVLCASATEAKQAFKGFLTGGLQAEYYVLLGFPLAAAVAAKALAQSRDDDGTLAKPPLEEDRRGFLEGLTEVVSNDNGETDLMDFQYLAFSLLTLGFFFMEFVTHPQGGLPDVPSTLLSLSGLSTAAYTTKKALET